MASSIALVGLATFSSLELPVLPGFFLSFLRLVVEKVLGVAAVVFNNVSFLLDFLIYAISNPYPQKLCLLCRGKKESILIKYLEKLEVALNVAGCANKL